MNWHYSNGEEANIGELIEAEVRHCNLDLNIPDKMIIGKFKEDGFYFDDGSELSWNWDIIRWRKIKE